MALQRLCYDCGTRTTAPIARCGCGEPLWLETDASTFDWDAVTDKPGMWRYEALLPTTLTEGIFAAAGGTPILRDSALDGFAGTNVHLKIEGQHPTGTFKDRGSALGLAAIEAGLLGDIDAVGTVSHGNMAMSTAAFAAATDTPCVVLVPDDISDARLGVIAQYGPTLLTVDGDYGRLYDETLELGPNHRIAFFNSDVPLRVEGQKTTTLELCESFAPETPDAIVMPASSGGHASGAWKALRELHAAGVIPELPPLYLVQATACAPIAEAYARGDTAVSPVEGGDTIAYSIANATPPSGTRALRAARATGGAVLSVTDDEIRRAQRTLATDAGLCVEAASATALAGIKRLAADGVLDEDDEVAVVVTGTGLKEASALATPTHVTVDDVDQTLASVVSDASRNDHETASR